MLEFHYDNFTSCFLLFLLRDKESRGLFRWLSCERSCLQCRRCGVPSMGWEDPLEEEMATHSSILAWKIPWTKEPGRLHEVTKSQTWLSHGTWGVSNGLAWYNLLKIFLKSFAYFEGWKRLKFKGYREAARRERTERNYRYRQRGSKISEGMGLIIQGKQNILFFWTGKNKPVNKSESSANSSLDPELGIEDGWW